MGKTVNLFASAKKAPVAEKKSEKKDDKAVVSIPGLRDYATVVDLKKNLEALEKTLRVPVIQAVKDFFKRATEKPDSFRGVDGEAKATCILAKRSTSSNLSDKEIELLEKLKLPLGEEVEVEERFVINPEIMDDQKTLEKISAALAKIPGCENFILHQEKKVKKVVTEETLTKVFEGKLFAEVGDLVSTITIKPSVTQSEETEVAASIARVQKLLKGEVAGNA